MHFLSVLQKKYNVSIFLISDLLYQQYKKVIIYDNTLTNFANNTVQNKSFGRYFILLKNSSPFSFDFHLNLL